MCALDSQKVCVRARVSVSDGASVSYETFFKIGRQSVVLSLLASSSPRACIIKLFTTLNYLPLK